MSFGDLPPPVSPARREIAASASPGRADPGGCTGPALISIVVPTFDRPAALSRCLDGIAATAGAGMDLEVVVVNDGGEPPSRAVIERLRGRLDVRVIERRRAGPAAACNAGAESARGTVVAFLDDDCVPQQGWLAALAVRCAAEPDAAIGGRTVNALPENP